MGTKCRIYLRLRFKEKDSLNSLKLYQLSYAMEDKYDSHYNLTYTFLKPFKVCFLSV